MNALMRLTATLLSILACAAIWHGDTQNATLMMVLAIACRQQAPRKSDRG